MEYKAIFSPNKTHIIAENKLAMFIFKIADNWLTLEYTNNDYGNQEYLSAQKCAYEFLDNKEE